MKRLGSLVLAAVFALAGCSSVASSGGGSMLPAPSEPGGVNAPSTATGRYIKHIVVIVQENRTFDNLFANYPGTGTITCGQSSTGTCIPLTPITFQETFNNWLDIDHGYFPARTAWDGGKMDKFDLNHLGTLGAGPRAGAYPYTYIERSQVAPYWFMAKQYVLADRMFPTMFGPSFTAHQDLIAGTTNLGPKRALIDFPLNPKTHAVVGPWGCDAPKGTITEVVNQNDRAADDGPFPCFTQYHTLAWALDNAGVSWRYFAPQVHAPDFSGAWSGFDAIKAIRYGPDWTRNVISPQTRVLTVAREGKLPAMTWVTPDEKDSDHPLSKSSSGPSWVAAVVNAIGEGKDWNSTAIVVVWDDWGGFYDNVPPPHYNNLSLGIRVPCLIISPYARKGYVDHTTYEFGSILKFAEQTFGLSYLGPYSSDERSNSLVSAFDFTQKPRAFVKIPVPMKYDVRYFMKERPSLLAPDPD